MKIVAHTATCLENPTFEIPILIGTYPIASELYASSNNEETQTRTTFLSTAPGFDEYLNASNGSIDSSDVPPYPDAGKSHELELEKIRRRENVYRSSNI